MFPNTVLNLKIRYSFADVALIHGLEMNKSVLETHLLNLKWKRQELIKSARLKKASSRFSNESGDLFKEREEFRGQSHCCPSDSNPDYHHVGKDESCLSKSLRRGKRDKSFGNLGNSSKKMGCSLLGWKSFRQVPLGFDQDCHGFPSDDSSGYEPSPIASYEDEVDMRGKTFGMKAALNKEILEDLGLFERELFEMDSAQMTVIINRDLENELKELSAI